jgi:Holliday junction resolvase RusA-like endonuclease
VAALRLTVPIKPLSVNEAFKGRHFSTDAKEQFEAKARFLLPKQHVPPGPYYRVSYDFHLVSFALTDFDNCIKVFQDCLVKRGIIKDDRLIVDARIRKFPAKSDRIEVSVEGVGLEAS